MGENLIALSKKGASCFGIDVSKHMVRLSEEKCQRRLRTRQPHFAVEDMRVFSSFSEVSFDLVLSVYSFEYLRSAKELRDVFSMISNRLKPGGAFVFCFSHPLQHMRHADLQNETAQSSDAVQATLIYSFRDVVTCLDDCGFTIDRIVEQQTENPSQIGYEESKRFPYHFHTGKNPCRKEYDKLSNSAPHTVIYSAGKPGKTARYKTHFLEFTHAVMRFWGAKWNVENVKDLFAVGTAFPVARLRAKKQVYLFCHILSFAVTSSDLEEEGSIIVPLGESFYGGNVRTPRCTLLGLVLKHSRRTGLKIIFSMQSFALREHPRVIEGHYIRRIDPLFGLLDRAFPRHRFGVLVFVNGEEPGKGKVGLDAFVPRAGDQIDIVYCAPERAQNNWVPQDPFTGELF